MKLYYPRDIFGNRTGIWDDHLSVGWVGWDVYWSQVAGQRLNMGGSSAYIDHSDAVGSTTMETDPAGGVQWDMTYFPWGQIWQQGGTRQSGVWAGLDWQINDPDIPSATREYSNNVNRWMTPDPGGRKVVRIDDPQTWNMYAYVGNNPTTLNDPGGLQSNCATGGGCSSNGESFEEDSMHFSDGRYGLDQITGLGIGMPEGLLNMLISAQQQNNADDTAEARATQAAEAVLNFTLAGAKIKFAAGLSTTSETGVGAMGAFYTGLSAAGNVAAGSIELVGALTGKTKSAEFAAEGASAATSALGLYTLVKTGSLDKAAGAAALEGIITSRPSDLTEGGTAARVAKGTELLQNIHRVEQRIENWF